MTALSIDSLLLAQIDDDSSDETSYFTDSEGVNFPIYDEDIDNNRYENTQRIEVYNLLGPNDAIAKDFDEPTGVYQISLFVTAGNGKGVAYRVMQELKDRYPRVVSGDPDLNVSVTSPNSPRVEGLFYRVDLSVNYFYFEKVTVA